MSKLPELQSRLLSTPADLIAITETWLSGDITDGEIQLPHMSVLRSDRATPGGGVALYYDISLSCSMLTNTALQSPDTMWCEVVLTAKHSSCLGIIYRPPNNSPEKDARLLHDIHLMLSHKRTHFLIMGDFNLPRLFHSVPSTNSFASGLIDLLHTAPLYNHTYQPTRFRSNNQPSLLDLVLTNEELMVEHVEYDAPLGLSDHCVLRFDFICFAEKLVSTPTYTKRWTDYGKLNLLISANNWSPEPQSSADSVWSSFCLTLRELCSTTTTCKEVSIGKRRPALIRSRTRKWIASRNTAWRNYRSHPTATQWEYYRSIRNQCVHLVREDKSEHQRQLMRKFSSNPKALYSHVNSLRQVKHGVTALTTPTGLTKSANEAAEVLCQQYASTFSVPSMHTTTVPSSVSLSTSLTTVHFTPEKVLAKLKSLRLTASPGADGFHPRLLRACAAALALPLAELFTHFFLQGKVPNDWKCGTITPIYKGGTRKDPANYRPITLLSTISKVMESIVADALMDHMEAQKLLSDCQHGFRRQRSCLSNLLLARDSWTTAADSGQETHVIFLDFAKAFDKVDHKILLRKLSSYGVSGDLMDWIRNYLQNRTFQVRVDGALSPRILATSGVPQGSVLGPHLFLAFIDDVTPQVESSLLLYADDAKLWRTINLPDDAHALQTDLDRLNQWSIENNLPFNASKCRVLSTRPSAFSPVYYLGASILQISSAERDLGIITQTSLSVSASCRKAAAAANRMVGLLKRAFGQIDPSNFRLLLNAFLRPHLEFAIQAWSPWLLKDQRILEAPQRRATKLVRGLKHLDYPQRLQCLGLYSLKYRRLRGDLILVFMILSNPGHPCRHLLTLHQSGSHLRGHPLRLTHQHSRLNCRRHYFALRICRPWNALPADLVLAPTVADFKTRLDCHLAELHRDIP
ncbi:unnamed protein product [Dicrocoelium dendriticum]|nr:unnamed protein product [Dicrocoelium dendriticum]